MHREWEELIPFYVAQTLSEDQALALASHLAVCESCQAALDEWREIGAAVQLVAEQNLDLPPLAEWIKSRITGEITQPNVPITSNGRTVQLPYPAMPLPARMLPSRPVAHRQSSVSLAQVAASAIVFFVIGAAMLVGLRLMTDRPAEPTQAAFVIMTSTFRPDAVIPSPTETLRPSATWTNTLTPVGIGIAQDTPVAPPIADSGSSSNDTSTGKNTKASPDSSVQTMIDSACYIVNRSNDSLYLYEGPGFVFSQIDTLEPEENIMVFVYNDAGWYEVAVDANRRRLWLYANLSLTGELEFSGRCESFVTPTNRLSPALTPIPSESTEQVEQP